MRYGKVIGQLPSKLIKMKQINKVMDCLYLSGWDIATCRLTLEALNIKNILSVCDGTIRDLPEGVNHKVILIEDDQNEDIITRLPEGIQFIAQALDRGENILVHCHMGISRSASFVVAYIMMKNRLSYESALDLVRKERECVAPNEGFQNQLKLFEEMGFTLREGANNQKLRRLLVSNYLSYTSHQNLKKNRIQEFYDRRDFIESLAESVDFGADCVCIKCGFKLFNEIHVICNTEAELKCPDGCGLRHDCDYTYIEPQKWMKQLSEPFDKMSSTNVKCPECEELLIEFQNDFSFYLCCCPKHCDIRKGLRFRISNQKYKILAKY